MLIAKKNREALFSKLQPHSIAILPGAVIQYRNNDTEYPFRQNSDFYYLTEFPEPAAIAVFIKEDNNSKNNQFILFNQDLDHHATVWSGVRIGQEQAMQAFGADIAYSINHIDQILPQLLLNKEFLYYPMFKNTQLESSLCKWQQDPLIKNKTTPKIAKDLLAVIHELRIIKSNLELEKIRLATQVSANAHNHVIKYAAMYKNLTEKHIHAEFYSYCLKHGCQDMAYQPIVASGKNACILHYYRNADVLQNNELVLIDAGAEYDYYAADITRVFPVNGKFSAPQKELYNLVLTAQKQAIDKIKPGVLWPNIHQEVVKVLVDGLIDLKILKGHAVDLIAQKTYQEFYMHGTGHFLGLDVHDACNINNSSRALEPGMVLTVEPGLYFSNLSRVAEQWRGIGIRIEDDILVTEHGSEILTKSAVKEVVDIENLMLI